MVSGLLAIAPVFTDSANKVAGGIQELCVGSKNYWSSAGKAMESIAAGWGQRIAAGGKKDGPHLEKDEPHLGG